MKAKSLFIGVLGVLSWITGCTTHPKQDDEYVVAVVDERLHKQVVWNKTHKLDMKHLELLQKELTPDACMQIALLNNPRIQILFEEIGLSQADVVNAQLFSNPALDLFIRFPTNKHVKTNVEYSLSQSIIDIFLIPLRVKVATEELNQTIFSVSHEILSLAYEVKHAYYELLLSERLLNINQSLSEIISIQDDIAREQYVVGNIQEIEAEEIHNRFLEAKLSWNESQKEYQRLRENLLRLLGISEDVELP